MFKKRRPPSALRFLFYAAGRWNRRWAPTAVDLVPTAFLWKKMGEAGSPGDKVGPQCGPHVRWLVGTKLFQESKVLPRIQKHVPESKNTSQNPNTIPRIQNTSIQESKILPRIQKAFGFWDVFCPYELHY